MVGQRIKGAEDPVPTAQAASVVAAAIMVALALGDWGALVVEAAQRE
jgi:hypothetical protein